MPNGLNITLKILKTNSKSNIKLCRINNLVSNLDKFGQILRRQLMI